MTKGTLPFLGATENNNGITGFTDKEVVKKWSKVGNGNDRSLDHKIFGPNWLAVTNNGSVGNVYFMEKEYTSSHDVTSLFLKERSISRELGLFLKTILQEAGKSFSYGRKWRPKRMKKTRIILPIDNFGRPNWQYMEQYIANILNSVIPPKLQPNKSSKIDLKSVKWKEFKIEEIFDKVSGVKGKTINNYKSGLIPYVTTSTFKNGVTNYISTDSESVTAGNVITIDPIKGKTFYHPYDFVGRGGAGSAINVLTNPHLNTKTGLFISTMIESNSFLKASYGTQLNGKRLRKQKVMLPVDDQQEINWNFMEMYVDSISNANLL